MTTIHGFDGLDARTGVAEQLAAPVERRFAAGRMVDDYVDLYRRLVAITR